MNAENVDNARPAPPRPPRGLALLRKGLGSRKAACMLGFGFSSGLPFALLIGTLTAWLGEVGVKLATIGVLSWIGLAYAFKFLWAPVVDRVRLPGLGRLGRRRGWIILCQAVLVAGIAGLALTDPKLATGRFAGLAFAAAFASATQDIAIDAWRIDSADQATPIELLSAIYQFGYRVASIVGGAIALFMAARMHWPEVFAVMAVLMLLAMLATLAAPDTRPDQGRRAGDSPEDIGMPDPRLRMILLGAVLMSWGWALIRLANFMATALAPPLPGVKAPSVTDFTRHSGPLILLATVVVPLAVAALANRWGALSAQTNTHETHETPRSGAVWAVADHLWSALITPLAELCQRLGWGVLSLLGFILTYAVAYNIWASFAYPFYLDTLHYSKDEVAFASKLFGIVMTMAGIGLCGFAFTRLGRMPTVLLGAILPPLGNFLYADLAEGGRGLDGFSHLFGLDRLALMLGSDERMVRLLLAISFENIATGLALTAFVAYLSGMVNRRYNVVQYALLSSLTSLIGTLGRGAVGEAFDRHRYDYGPVFRWTAAAGLVSVTFVALEWWRTHHRGTSDFDIRAVSRQVESPADSETAASKGK